MTEKPLLCWVRQKNGLFAVRETAALSVTQFHPEAEISLTDEKHFSSLFVIRVLFAYDGVSSNYGLKDGAGAVLNVRRVECWE